MIWHNLNWLQENHPEAFEALPEPYKADSCLEFCTNMHGSVFSRPVGNQVEVLGDWICRCVERVDKKWVWKGPIRNGYEFGSKVFGAHNQ